MEGLVEREEAQTLFGWEEPAGDTIDLWPGIQPRLNETEESRVRSNFVFRWKWAFSAACLSLFILAGFWFVRGPGKVDLASWPGAEEKIQINYLKVEEKPAGAYVFQPQDSEMIFVWAVRTP